MNIYLDGDDDDIDTSVEDSILNDVEEATGVSFDDDEEIQKPEEPVEDEVEKPKQEAATEQQAPKQGSRSREIDPAKRANREQIQGWLSARRRVDYDYDQGGNVVDKEGKVLFAIGTPARELFSALKNEQFERSKITGQAQQLFTEYNQQKQQLDAYSNAFKAGSDLGLRIEDQAQAMQMMAAFKKDPVQGIRKILHDYQVDGGDLSEIFEDLPKLQSEGIEARLKAMADRIEAPEREKAQQATQQQEAMNRVNQEIQTFFGENPLAEVHAPTLAHIVQSATDKGQKVSLSQAWIRLMQFCNERGLRLDAPLEQQLSDAPQQQQQKPVQRAMPGRGRSNGLSPKQSNKPTYDRSNRDFVREAMEEAGITFDS